MGIAAERSFETGMTISILGMGGSIALALLIGYFWGRNESRILQQKENGEEAEDSSGLPTDGQSVHTERRYRSNMKHVPQGRAVGSPTAGKVTFFCEGGRKGAVIEPEQGKLFAPVSGKIIRLFPMGNAFILQGDEQSGSLTLIIQVGKQHPDELCSMYFRSRIVQNEIVSKGKLLLEFDKEKLQAAGEDVGVIVCVEDGAGGEVTVTQRNYVKAGDELMWVSKVSEQ